MPQNISFLLTTFFATQPPYQSTDIRWETPYAVCDTYRWQNEELRIELYHRHGDSPFVKRETNAPLEICTLLLFTVQDSLKEWYLDEGCDGSVEQVTLNPNYDYTARKIADLPEEGKRIVGNQYANALEVFLQKE